MTYKAFENKSPDMLKERVQNDYPSQLQSVLTSVKGVNKTDVITLSTNFGVSDEGVSSRSGFNANPLAGEIVLQKAHARNI
jgi:hypothetical protein